MKQALYIKRFLMFMAPVLLFLFITELLARSFDNRYKLLGDYLKREAANIEVLAFGTSQTGAALNPQYMQASTLNIAGSGQHYVTDSTIYQKLIYRLPNLKVIVLELSFAHLELPLEEVNPWKETLFHDYLDIDLRTKKNWYDRLVFLSNPRYFTRLIINQRVRNIRHFEYNTYGFKTYRENDLHRSLYYDREKINQFPYPSIRYKYTNREITHDPEIFTYNLDYLENLIQLFKEDKMEVIIAKPPLYGKSIQDSIPKVIHKRDSAVGALKARKPWLHILDLESDSTHFTYLHFSNRNHLNPSGARIYTQKLDSVVRHILEHQ